MPTLEEMAAMGGGAGAGNPPQSDRDDYLAYQEACIMAGVKPKTMTEWVQAGKPKGP